MISLPNCQVWPPPSISSQLLQFLVQITAKDFCCIFYKLWQFQPCPLEMIRFSCGSRTLHSASETWTGNLLRLSEMSDSWASGRQMCWPLVSCNSRGLWCDMSNISGPDKKGRCHLGEERQVAVKSKRFNSRRSCSCTSSPISFFLSELLFPFLLLLVFF